MPVDQMLGSDPASDTTGPPQSTDAAATATEKPDYGKWNETLPDQLQECLKRLAQDCCDEFKYPRRMQIMAAWRGRSYWREMQHLQWNWDSEWWDVGCGPAMGSTRDGGDKDSAVMYTTNTYQGFGESFIAIITQATPNLRFEPEDIEEAADVETAKAAEPFRKLCQHENDPIKLMTKAAYYAWTDGLICGWTRWEVDKRTGTPREMQSIAGAMEVKVPTITEELCEALYLQYSTEYHLATAREKVRGRDFEPSYWKKLKGGSTGNGQDTYERTARISVKQGISMRSAGGDAYSHLTTCQRTWMRPAILYKDTVEEADRAELIELFPNGIYVEFDNGVYTGSRDATMDDEWAIENVMEGDGNFRNAKGTCLLSVQERTNDLINTTQDTFEKAQPAGHYDDKLFDIDGMKKQRSMSGAKYGLDFSQLQAGDSIANHVYFEPAASVDPSQLGYLKELMTDVPEFLTGISAVLFGADQSGDKSGKALSIQQAAAMGRIGLPFRVLKRFYAKMMEQAIRCASRNRATDWQMGIPDENGVIEPIAVRVGDMFGRVRVYPDSDENVPESWTSKRATYMQLLMEGNTDPIMKGILSNPENQMLAKKLIGLSDLVIPDAASWNKQSVEINLLLQSPPPPPVPQPPKQIPNPMVPTIMESIPQPPLQISSIPIDPDYDNNQAEYLTVWIWVNGCKGQKAKKEQPQGFMNVRLHGLEHKKALAAAMPPPAPPAPAMGHHAPAPPHAGPPPAPGAGSSPAPALAA